MTEIYSNAETVVAWLQTPREDFDAAPAFSSVREGVFDYLVLLLCRLQYWARKWIIQEIVEASTVTLRCGPHKCSLSDFERLCLHARDTIDSDLTESIIRTPAGKLVLQRLESVSADQTSSQLRRLLPRSADSNCEKLCNHVYALYNLIGEHRRKLSTDYAADPVQRFVDVLTFTRDFESLTSDEGLKIIRLLMKLFDLRASEILEDSSKTRSLTFTIKIHLLGRVKVGLASTELLAMRKQYMTLWDTPAYQFRKVLSHTNTSKTEWRLAGVATSSLLPNYIPSSYSVHFNMNDRQIHGVASTLPIFLRRPLCLWCDKSLATTL
jgi:hypothetical protein